MTEPGALVGEVPKSGVRGFILTAKGSGYYEVYRAGTLVSRHNQEREAIEAAQLTKSASPEAHVEYRHNYSVSVEIAK